MNIIDKIDNYLNEAKTTPEFDKAFDTWIKGAQKKIDDYYKKMKYDNQNRTLSYTNGPKRIKIIQTNEAGNTSVFAFIDKTTGDVLKPASWKAPAKGARGNIFDRDNGLGRITAYGPEYNR